jgi:hypothetical protein
MLEDRQRSDHWIFWSSSLKYFRILFIYNLFYDALRICSGHSVSSYYTATHLEGLKKTMRNFSHCIWCPGRNAHWALREFELKAVSPRTVCYVIRMEMLSNSMKLIFYYPEYILKFKSEAAWRKKRKLQMVCWQKCSTGTLICFLPGASVSFRFHSLSVSLSLSLSLYIYIYICTKWK